MSLFLINLDTAARHSKFQLEQTLVDSEISRIENVCCEAMLLLNPSESLKCTQNVFLSKEQLGDLKASDDHMSKNDWIAVSKDASTLIYENTTTSTTPRDIFASKLSAGHCLSLGVRKRNLIEAGKSELAQLSHRFVSGEIHTFRREKSHDNDKAPSATPGNKKSSRPRRQRSQEDQGDREITKKRMLWESNQNSGTTPTNLHLSTAKANDSVSQPQIGTVPSGLVSSKNAKPSLLSYLGNQKQSQSQLAQKPDFGASKNLGQLHTAIFQPGVLPQAGLTSSQDQQKSQHGKKKARGKSNNHNKEKQADSAKESKDQKEPKLFGEKLSVILNKLSVGKIKDETPLTNRGKKKE